MNPLSGEPKGTQARILIVDDERSMQKLVSRIMETAGFSTQIASDGQEALDCLNTAVFDLVISDISMPVMDGLALTEKISQTVDTDVILMTGKFDQYSYGQVIGLGASDYIQKPFSPEEIVLRARRVLRERQMRKETIQFHKEQAQTQRLESIGQLAAGIAHEINTPIQYIGDNTTFMKETFQDLNHFVQKLMELFEAAKEDRMTQAMLQQVDTAVEETDFDFIAGEIPVAIDQTLEGVSRIKEIIKAMKVFAHPGNESHVQADLNQCLKDTVTLSKNEWKYIADLVMDLDPDLPSIPCNPGELSQVFLNLIVNASHAIADKMGPQSQDKGMIRISTQKNNNWIEIRISDTGTGIPDDVIGKIFDPFFTTKEIGKGTGQGLAISRSVVVKRHNGRIDIDTSPIGTTFTIKLPAADG